MSNKQTLNERFAPCPLKRRASVLGLCLALLGAGSMMSAVPATAQTASAPTIEVAGEIKVAAAVISPLRIKIGRAAGLSNQALLMVRGLPPRVTLSEGRSFSPGVWMVPLANLGKLEIAPATGTVGKSDITLELMTLDGKILAEAQTTLVIASGVAAAGEDTVELTAGPLPGNPQAVGALRQDPANRGAPLASLTRDEIDRARKLVEKGDESMQAGKITTARLFYQSAADSGWAPAALALGATYDGDELARSKVVGGVQPNPALAKKWYAKAKELGSPEAERHLQRLGAR